MAHSYQLHELGPLGTKLGDGKQGLIYALPQNPNFVFKRYKNRTYVDEATLTALIDWPSRLAPAEKTLVQETTAWPVALVREGTAVVGVVIPRAPARFTYHFPDGTSTLTTLTLAYSPDRSGLFRNLPQPNLVERLSLAYGICWLLALFERDGIVFLDLSSTNILWSLDPTPAVFFIDCDSASILGLPTPRARIVRTDNFYDPWFQNPPSHEEIRGTFSLLFARLVFAREYANSESHIILMPPDNPYALSFQPLVDNGYAPDRARRPSMLTWLRRIEAVLGLPPAPLASAPEDAAVARPLQVVKELFENGKAVVSRVRRRNLIADIETAIRIRRRDMIILLAVILVVIYMRLPGVQYTPIDSTRSLYEVVWEYDKPVFCESYQTSLYAYIYAYGRGERRKIRIDTGFLLRTHFIIKSKMAYRWTDEDKKGYRFYADGKEIKKLLAIYQKARIVDCQELSRGNNRLFDLPSNVEFATFMRRYPQDWENEACFQDAGLRK